ncbi:MAG: hypothetical protein ACR652_00620 [Methylocystis sp.]|uniref:hypothetical protein n=1 Tax=Methylocystis sp. TaxID=1911079 RepID=UPI003DA254D0
MTNSQQPDISQPDKFEEWLRELDEDVIQGQYGYEPGELTVYSSHWRPLFEEGISPLEAWKRALDGHANARREREDAERVNYARIVDEDQAAVARARNGAADE